MNKIYRISLLLIALIFLSTFNPKEVNLDTDSNLFKIKKIEINNNILINEKELKKKLSYIFEKNIFFLKKEDIREPLKDVDFLEKIEVKKKYPDTIIIKVFETEPLAIIFKNELKYLLDSSSNLIPLEDKINYEKLPKVFGKGAESNFVYFFSLLKKNNFPINKIKNFYFFQIGRWNLQLLNDNIIKFPHENIEESIIKSMELLNREDFKNYNIIDLRVNGKIIVE